ncbi:MAG: prepilin peptidase [Lachnospiraceae bacterium]|nr:prepilin peptidase [Lachnospiraceae bacterium]MBR1876325.1 prepilin peptidase [Lachnospiraceae bacterium]
MLINTFLGIFLIICSITDIKFKEIRLNILIVFALAGVVLFFIYRPVSLFEEIMGLFTGLVFIGLWALTEGKIGLGDGLLMTVTGIYLGGRENAFMVMTAMLLSAVFSIVILILKKGDRNARFAFAPFILISFVLRTVISQYGY